MTKALDLIDGKPCLVEMPEPFSLAVTRHEWEEACLRADLEYLEKRQQREAHRLAEVQELERGYSLRTGWAF